MASHSAERPPSPRDEVPEQQLQSSSRMAAQDEELPPPNLIEVLECERMATMKQCLMRQNIEFDHSFEGVSCVETCHQPAAQGWTTTSQWRRTCGGFESAPQGCTASSEWHGSSGS